MISKLNIKENTILVKKIHPKQTNEFETFNHILDNQHLAEVILSRVNNIDVNDKIVFGDSKEFFFKGEHYLIVLKEEIYGKVE